MTTITIIKLTKPLVLAAFIALIWVGGSFIAFADPVNGDSVALTGNGVHESAPVVHRDTGSNSLPIPTKISSTPKGTAPIDIDLVFSIGFWFLGSALLAMVGYKRMRNDQTPMSDA